MFEIENTDIEFGRRHQYFLHRKVTTIYNLFCFERFEAVNQVDIYVQVLLNLFHLSQPFLFDGSCIRPCEVRQIKLSQLVLVI